MNQPGITAEQFDAIAGETCKRWSERSLAVARSLVVSDRSISEVASEHDMTPQQANVIRSRFVEKVERYRVESFTKREPPAQPSLDRFGKEMRMLHSQGYSIEQITAYLADECGVKTTPEAVSEYLEAES